MSFKRSAFYLSLCLVGQFVCLHQISFGFQAVLPNDTGPVATAPNVSNGTTAGTLISTYIDANGQPYGRYMINETIAVVEYEFRPVTEQIYLPVTVTELRNTSVPQYIPVWSQQWQLQNVPSWNPFARPQQVWRYVPVVQYQTKYVQESRPFTFQKYEKKEVTKMVPDVSNKSRPVSAVVDRPLGPNGGNTIAVNANTNNVMTNNSSPGSAIHSNPYQQAAQIAQANRNQSRFPTRPIGPPYGYSPGRNLLAQAPAAYYPNYPSPSYNPANTYSGNPMLANATQQTPPANNNIVIPAVPLRPEPSNLAVYNGYGANPNPNQFAPNPVYPPVYPNVNTASRPIFNWPTFASGTGSLFGNSLFSNNRNTNYVASNTPVTQPYVLGNNNNVFSGSSQSGLSFRPNSSPYATSPYAAPQQNWGMVPSNTYRDPMQGGMPATVLR